MAAKKKTSKKRGHLTKKSAKKTEAPRRPRGRPRKKVEKVIDVEPEVGHSDPSVKDKKSADKKTTYFGKKIREEDNAEIKGTTRISKKLGYCSCGLCLGENDIEEGKKTIVICPRCGERTRKNRLLGTAPEKEPNLGKEKKAKKRSKKDYLDVGIDHDDVIEAEVEGQHREMLDGYTFENQ